MSFKVGDRVISDLDGLQYEIVQIGARDDMEPLPGVKLIGNAVIVKNQQDEQHLLYEWEIEKAIDPGS